MRFLGDIDKHFVTEQKTFEQNTLSPKNGKREAQSAERHVCVGWCVKWNSLWCYTTFPSYNFIKWMISLIVSVCLWCQCNILQSRTDLFNLPKTDYTSNYIKVDVQTWLGNNCSNFGQNLNHQTAGGRVGSRTQGRPSSPNSTK